MDALTYNYIASSNKLNFVADPTPVANYTEDIDAQLTGNYTYDAIGNLKTDVKEGMTRYYLECLRKNNQPCKKRRYH